MDNCFQDSAAEEKILTAPIKDIMENSIAGEMDIEPGDKLYSINGNEINDILDYQFYSQEDYLLVEIEKANSGELWVLEIEKEYDEELGLLFDGLIFDKMKLCQNRCLFCFVDQLDFAGKNIPFIKTNTAGINNDKLPAVPVRTIVQSIPGYPGYILHYRLPGPGQAVK
jgi:hypothetical protein